MESSAHSPARIWAAIVLFALLLRTPYLVHTMHDVDEGCHAAIATTLLDGGLPYRDAADNKFPGIYYLYAAVFWVFGNYNLGAVHALTFVASLLTAIVLARFAAQLGSPAAGPWVAFFYLTFSTLWPANLAGNTEMFMVLPYAASASLLWRSARGCDGRGMFAAGGLAALATLFKQVAGVMWAVGLAFLCWQALGGAMTKRRALWLATCLTLGFALPLAMLCGYYFQRGCFDDFVYWTFTSIGRYLNASRQRLNVGLLFAVNFLPFALACGVLWVAAVRWLRPRLAAFRFARHSDQTDLMVLLSLWLAASMAGAFTGQRMFPHYFLQFLPPLCLMAGLGTSELLAGNDGRGWRRALVAGSIVPSCVSWIWALGYIGETPLAYLRPSPDYRPAVEYLRAHTTADDRAFVWGWFTPLYVHTGLKPGTRFVFSQNFVTFRPEFLQRESHWIGDTSLAWTENPDSWAMLEEDFRKRAPELVLDTSPGNYNKFGNFPMSDFPRLTAILRGRYRHEATVAGIGIYRLIPEATTPHSETAASLPRETSEPNSQL